MAIPPGQDSAVFYNPVQVQNRDLSILMIALYAERRAVRAALQVKRKQLKKEKLDSVTLQQKMQEYEQSLDGTSLVKEQSKNDKDKGLTILDALAASGLRSIRYWKEIPGVKHVTINDLEAAAVDRARDNVKLNNVQEDLVPESDTATKLNERPLGIGIQQGDATHELYLSRGRPSDLLSSSSPFRPQWDVIDLDPYGSAAPFLDAAIQAIADGGFICCTCTDMAALGGSHPETCFGRYASMPIQRAGYLQEVALRILLHAMASSAARYGRTIRPVLSVGMNFYIRVFVEVCDNKAGVNDLSLQTGYVYQSTNCPSFHIVRSGQMGGKKGNVYKAGRAPDLLKCEETGAAFKVGGPMWMGQLHDQSVVAEALKRLESEKDSVVPDMKYIATRNRLRGLLESCRDELPDVPLFYKLQDLAQTLQVSTLPLKAMKGALVNAGFRVSGYHKEPQAIKTDAPNRIVWDVMRSWYKKNPPKKQPKEGSAAAKIIAVEPSIEVDFTIPASILKNSNISRFPLNPERNWGPKAKASGNRKRKATGKPDEES